MPSEAAADGGDVLHMSGGISDDLGFRACGWGLGFRMLGSILQKCLPKAEALGSRDPIVYPDDIVPKSSETLSQRHQDTIHSIRKPPLNLRILGTSAENPLNSKYRPSIRWCAGSSLIAKPSQLFLHP